ncbi:MAG: shikimate dehydrogenase [Dehalococcoidia bacterium]|nr:shikimate dehydrogenase [Dehalococcoidia bacterium]
MTLLAGIFGYPIRHSISPAMHNAAFAHRGIDAVYSDWETTPDDLAAGVSSLRGEDYMGANVTVPYKQAVMEHLDEIDDLATRIGAVNTIVNRDGRLMGSNTDALGFINSLRSEAGITVAGLEVALIGAGGAARAAAYALADERATSLAIANRTVERAESLADEISQTGLEANAFSIDSREFLSACGRADLIVNSTSVGMLHGPAEGKSPIPVAVINSESVVYDMVYNPPDTPLLADAESAGARCVGGLPMLVYQGAAAWSRWTGREAPVEVMFGAAKKALDL